MHSYSSKSQSCRVASTRRRSVALRAVAHSSSAEIARGNAADTIESGCPVSALKAKVSAFRRPKDAVEHDGFPPAPPGPAAFSLQSALDVSNILRFGIHEAMLRFCTKYGDVCRFANPASLNGKSGWIFVNDPQVVQHCAADNVRNYQMRYLPDIYTWITHGKGILGSQGDYNAKHRRLCAAPFRTPRLLRQFSNIITDRALTISESLATAATKQGSGRPLCVDVSLHTQRLTLDIVGMTAFSHDFRQAPEQHRQDMMRSWSILVVKLLRKSLDWVEQTHKELVGAQEESDQNKLLWAVNTFGDILAQVFITPLPILKVLDKLGFQELKKLSQAVDIMRSSMLGVIAERREALARGEAGPDDLLGTLLNAVDDDGSKLTDEELWEDVHDVMGAGHETTATTTAAVLYCVSVHPEVEQKLTTQLQEVCGTNAPTYDDLERLPYLKQVVREVLRLYPAIPIFPREAAAPDILPTGHRVDAGDVVFMSSYALGRSAELWEDPLQFDPERFAPERAHHIHRFQFLPFGAGPRMCLGSMWAEMSVSLMAGTLLQRLKFTAVKPTEQLIPVDYDITMNYNPTNGLHMQCEPRQASL